jgi:hypothetical protein
MARLRSAWSRSDCAIADQPAHELHHGGLGLHEAAAQHVGHHQRAGIDEGVARDAVLVFELHQRVECIAGWLASHALPQRFAFELEG